MKVKCAVFAYQPEWQDFPTWQFFTHGTEGNTFGADYTLVDPDAEVEFKTLEDAALIRAQIKSLEGQKTRIDAEAYRQKIKLDDRIGKLLALTYTERGNES